MASGNPPIGVLSRQSIDSIQTIGGTLLNATEQTLALNLRTTRSLFEHNLATLRTLAEADTPQTFWAQAPKLAQPGIEELVGWSRGLYEISSNSQQSLSREGEALLSEVNKSLASLLDQAERNAPSGSEHGIAAVRTALSATRNTLENISQASRKVAEITDANVAAAASAAVKSASGASRSAARKAA
ncbi:phasin family protein [Pseudothauera nasutitermitis]|nr:phasin family protein [Pseudothauera nasutitermitis]